MRIDVLSCEQGLSQAHSFYALHITSRWDLPKPFVLSVATKARSRSFTQRGVLRLRCYAATLKTNGGASGRHGECHQSKLRMPTVGWADAVQERSNVCERLQFVRLMFAGQRVDQFAQVALHDFRQAV